MSTSQNSTIFSILLIQTSTRATNYRMDQQPSKKKGGWRKAARIILRTLLGIILLIVTVLLLILTPPVQHFITGKATAWMEKKIGTKVEIGRLFITLTGKIAIDDVYLEDRSRDTLFSAGQLRVNMSFYDIIFNNELDIKSVRLDDATAKIRRQLPDTAFNFQYIIDAFTGGKKDTSTVVDTSAAMAINIGTIELNNLRLIYKDVVTGNDVEAGLAHFDTRVDKFDLDKMHFIIPAINIRSLTAKVIQTKPLIIAPASADTQLVVSTTTSPAMILDLRHISIQKSAIDYTNNVGAMYANASIGDLDIKPKNIDLANSTFDLGDILLHDTKAIVRMEKTQTVQPAVVVDKTNVDTLNDQQAMRLLFSSLDIKAVDVQFDDMNKAPTKQGLDFAHLNSSISTFQVSDFKFAKDSIGANITDAAFTDQSGFQLQQFKTNMLYASNQAYLKDLYIKTPGTEIKRDIALRYASLDAMTKDLGNLQIDADIDNSRIAVKDILAFVPTLKQQPAFADPNAVWYLDGRVTGSVNDLHVERLSLSGLGSTRMNVTGNITGLPDAKKFNADLVIHELTSSRRDLMAFMPPGSLPANITLPNRIGLSGRIKGGMEDLLTDLKLNTDLGNASVKGRVQHITDAKKAIYDVQLATQRLDLGTIMQDRETYGPVSVSLVAKGHGYDPKTANGTFKGKVISAIYKKYDYRDLNLDASVANQLVKAKASMQDPNLHFDLDATADVSGKDPAVKMELMIDSIKANELHLTPDLLVFHGKISADFPNANPDSLIGTLLMTQSLIVNKEQRISMDTVSLVAGMGDSASKRFLALNTDILNMRLDGIYKLTEMGTVMQRSIDPYWKISGTDSLNKVQSSYDFSLTAEVINGPVLKSFVPALDRLDSLKMTSHFNDYLGWSANITSPAIDMGTNSIRGLNIDAVSGETAIDINTTIKQIKSGTAVQIDNAKITASVANSAVDFNLNIMQGSQDKYNVGGRFSQPSMGTYQFSLRPTDLVLNSDPWTVSPNNKIVIADDIRSTDFILSQGTQQLSINSSSSVKNSPLDVKFENFKIVTLTGFVMSDSTLVDGLLNGQANVKNVMTEPVFTADLTVNDLSVKGDTVGNVKALVNNQTANAFDANVAITGRGNDVVLSGQYFTNNSTFKMLLDIRDLPMATAQALSAGAINQATGNLTGKFDIAGSVDKPAIDGSLNFNKVGFNPTMLNNYLRIDQESIVINSQGITLNNFEIRDSSNNEMVLDGTAATTNFKNYVLNLGLKAQNFRALNSTKKDNKVFYGKLYFDTDLKITGNETNPVIDGRIKINKDTKFTVVLPQSDPGVVERDGIVEFVDMDAPATDSMFLAAYDSLNKVDLTGAQVSMNIEIDKEADLTVIVDEGNGDFLNVKGEALLNTTITPGGEVSVAGTYELEQGAYNLSFNGIKRRFDIQKGSRITLAGEPTDANLDLTAIYVSSTAPLDLVKDQLGTDAANGQSNNRFLQKLPFQVLLKMNGPLLKPSITFDIILPENQNYGVDNDVLVTVRTKLDQLRQEDAEMNKQVFALLLLNRFVAENPFASSGAGFSAATLARQSVSKLMTEQLNKLAGDLVAGVDLNFDVQSSEDYSTGQRADRTDLNVGLSKRLLNDRLTVTVGSNFELEGPANSNQQSSNIAGNVALNYALSKDGRYQLRAYRKNDYQGVIEGYIIETGVGFIITLDYNRFREIIHKKKLERERKARQEKRKQEQQDTPQTTPTNREVEFSAPPKTQTPVKH